MWLLRQSGRRQMRVQVPPWLANRGGATRHGDRLEHRQPPRRAIIGQQKFAAPDRAVLAPTEAVQHDAQYGRRIERMAVLGQAGSDMGVMVLYLDHRQAGCLGIFRRQVFGMHVGRDRSWRVIEQRGVMGDVAAVVVVGPGVFQIADVLRQDRLSLLQQAESVLQFATGGQQVRGGVEAGGQRNGTGRETAGTAQHAWRTGNNAHH